jgi:hypothetical protein
MIKKWTSPLAALYNSIDFMRFCGIFRDLSLLKMYYNDIVIVRYKNFIKSLKNFYENFFIQILFN